MFQIAHNEHGLRCSADVESGGRAGYFDPQMGPFVRHHVGVRLILARCLATQAIKIVSRERKILGRVVAAKLVFGTTVGRPDIETFARKASASLVDPERNSDESASVGRGIRKR